MLEPELTLILEQYGCQRIAQGRESSVHMYIHAYSLLHEMLLLQLGKYFSSGMDIIVTLNALENGKTFPSGSENSVPICRPFKLFLVVRCSRPQNLNRSATMKSGEAMRGPFGDDRSSAPPSNKEVARIMVVLDQAVGMTCGDRQFISRKTGKYFISMMLGEKLHALSTSPYARSILSVNLEPPR